MKNVPLWLGAVWLGCLAAGCKAPHAPEVALDTDHYRQVATQIEFASVETPVDPSVLCTEPPATLRDEPTTYQDVSLNEVIEMALRHSRVMRDLSANVLRAPQATETNFDPAIQESDPRSGVQAALSAFDAQFKTGLFANKRDRRYNNQFLGDRGFVNEDFDSFQAELTKRSVTGGEFALREIAEYQRDNSPANTFPSGGWTAILEGEVRQPLLQGAGAEFNRIAGPDQRPGVYNGVLIARTRTDITLAEFEIALRDFVSNVENTYWDLYFAYRDLHAKTTARDAALETWRAVHALHGTGRRGGEAEKEAQAREQYFRFKEEVENALAGRLLEGTRTYNGSPPGTLRGTPGVQLAERRLRLLMGLPANGCELLRPCEEPPLAPLALDWCQVSVEALAQRAELRRQRWEVKARELELAASRNYLLPDLDLVAQYRFRGFGKELIDAKRDGKDRFDNAMMDLTSGDFQEWQVGIEYTTPLGFRQAHAGVRNATLRVSRERALLREQERQVIHDLSNAVADVARAYDVMSTDYNRLVAAEQQYAAVEAAYQAEKVEFFVVLDAQRRRAEAESRYYLSRVDYALAIRNLHFEKGSLLDYHAIALAEGPWPGKAYADALRREMRRGRPLPTDYGFGHPTRVSAGPCPPPVAVPGPPVIVPVAPEGMVLPEPADARPLEPGAAAGEPARIEFLPPPPPEELQTPAQRQ